MRLLLLALLSSCAPLSPASGFSGRPGGDAVYDEILGLRERAQLMDRLLLERLDVVVPEIMREVGADAWVITAREYNEDPVIRTMLPANWFAARRRTMLVFFDRGPEQGVERFAVSRYAVGDLFPAMWNPDEEPDQWKRLADLLTERNPQRIVLNGSKRYGHADGLTHFEYEALRKALPAALAGRLSFDDRLAVAWLETRTPAEMELYPLLCRVAHEIIAEGFSSRVVKPGQTTTKDVEWWYRGRMAQLDLGNWFHPHVTLQRSGADERSRSFATVAGEDVIQRGDLLHVDLGITYLDLNTDTQQHAYVLRAKETAAPEDLRAGLAVGNRLQDLLTSSFATGRSGNEILAMALEKAAQEGIDASIYTHPLGYHGHGAGPTIGMWDQQQGVPGSGDYALRPNTVFSIELNAKVTVPAWDDASVLFMLEEDAFFDGQGVHYLDGRQEELLLIR